MTTAEALDQSAVAEPELTNELGRWNRWGSAAVVILYLLLGIAAYRPLAPWSSTRMFGIGSDSMLATWFLAWIPHSLAHGLNPLFSNAIYVPDGVNLAQNTTAPLLGLLTAPFAPFLSGIARGNLFMMLAMPVSAMAVYFALRKWNIWAPAAMVGGLIYGFSPFAIGQGLGHLVLVFLPLPPFIISTAAAIVLGMGSPTRQGIKLGLLLAAQFLSEPEVFVILILLAAGVFACAAVRFPRASLEKIRSLVWPTGVAVTSVAAILAYPVWMELLGPQHYVGTAQPISNPYYNDLLSFVHPGPLQRVSLGMRSLAVPLSNASESGSYIGIPLLLLAIGLSWRSRRTYRMQIAVTSTVGAILLSMGRRLVVDGHVTSVHLPFGVLVHMPLLGNILPSRFSIGVFLGLAGILAFGIDDVRRNPTHQGSKNDRHHWNLDPFASGAAVAGVTLVALVGSQFPAWPYPYQPVRSLPQPIRNAIPGDDPVAITYPYATAYFAEAQLWQLQSGFSFRLLGGYAEHPNVHRRSSGIPNPIDPPGLDLFLEGQEAFNPGLFPPVPVTPHLLDLARSALSGNNVRLVIVDSSAPGAGPPMMLFSQLLGPPSVSSGRYALWAAKGDTSL